MIEFEGFELVHPEAGQLNKGLRTQPYIDLMGLFGARKPSTKTTTQNKLTSWQEESYQDSKISLVLGRQAHLRAIPLRLVRLGRRPVQETDLRLQLILQVLGVI